MLLGSFASGFSLSATSAARRFFNGIIRLIGELESGSNSQGRSISGGFSPAAWSAGTALTALSPDNTIAMPFCASAVSNICNVSFRLMARCERRLICTLGNAP